MQPLLPHPERIQPQLRLGTTIAKWNSVAELRADARPDNNCDWPVWEQEHSRRPHDIPQAARDGERQAEALAPPREQQPQQREAGAPASWKKPAWLRPGNLQTQFFRQSFADFRREAIVHVTSANHGHVHHGHGRWGGHRHDQPDQR
jgi:hypothetical protein